MSNEDDDKNCGFCGKSRREVDKLIGSDRGLFICNECVARCVLMLLDSKWEEALRKL